MTTELVHLSYTSCQLQAQMFLTTNNLTKAIDDETQVDMAISHNSLITIKVETEVLPGLSRPTWMV